MSSRAMRIIWYQNVTAGYKTSPHTNVYIKNVKLPQNISRGSSTNK